MKNKWLLLTLVFCALPSCNLPDGGLGSAAPDYQYDPSTGGYVSVTDAAYYDQPLYSYGSVNYYYVSGRYMYDSGYGPIYVNQLPYGGYYNPSHPVYPCRSSRFIQSARSRPMNSAPVLSVTNKVVVNKTYVQQTNINQVNVSGGSSGVSASRPIPSQGGWFGSRGTPTRDSAVQGSRDGASSAGGLSRVGVSGSGKDSAPSQSSGAKTGYGSGFSFRPSSSSGAAVSDAMRRDARQSSSSVGLFSRSGPSGGTAAPREPSPIQTAGTKLGSGVPPRPPQAGGGAVRPTAPPSFSGGTVLRKEAPVAPISRPPTPMAGPMQRPSSGSAPAPASAPASAPKKKVPGAKPEQP